MRFPGDVTGPDPPTTRITRDEYPRKQTTDLGNAIALGVTRFLTALVIPSSSASGPTKFSAVFDEWPNTDDQFVPTGACVLPFDLTYGPSHLEPILLEDTWVPAGQPGFGLFEEAEATAEISIEIRAASRAERNAAVAALEDTFRKPRLDLPSKRYGVVTKLDEYFGLHARLSLISSSKPDDAGRADANMWEATIVLQAEAKQVSLNVVQPMTIRIDQYVDGELG